MRTVVTCVMIGVLLSLLVACGGEQAVEVVETEAPTEEAAQVAEEPTETPEPEPTDTPEPTEEPTVEATVAAEFELEPLEHPSGAFSSLVPVDAFLTDVDSDDLEFPSVRATYLDRLIIQEGDIAFGVSASIQPKADDAILADIYEEVLDNMSSADTESIEIVSQEQLDEDRLLFDLKGIDETLTDGKLLLVDGGPSVFALLFLTSDVEATAGTWAAISEGYTYDPALTADLLANPDAFAEEAADIELERMEHPSGAFSVMIPVEAMETGIDSREAKRPSINSFYMDMENLDMDAAPLTLGVAADIRAKSDEVTLEDLSSDFLDEMSLELEVDPETISQEQEWLDDERLLTDLVISDPTGGEQKMYLKTLLVDGGASVFNLTILTTNLEATESAQTEILDSYTYDPDLAAELLAERAVAAEVEEALAAAEANIEAEAYEEAIADYDTAIELDPENFLAYAGRAWVHQQMEEYDKAIADYSQAIDLDPEEGWAYNERAWTYRLMEAYEEALPDVNKALQLDPESAAAYNTRGEIYFELGEMEKAIADLTQAIELGAEYDENYYFRGMAYQAQEETDKAIADLEYFLEISSNSELIAEAEQTLEALQSSGATTEASPTPEEPVAAVDIELEPFEHPSGAFSILIPADSWSTGVDSAAESKYPSLYSNYVEDDIGFGLEAAVFPKPEDAALEDMFDVFLNDVILRGKIDVEVISQEQERLDDDRLLADVALLSPGMAGHPLHQKVLLVDGGTSVFGLVVEDQDLEATEPVWTEILNSYTYDPELTADLLAKY